MKEPLMDAGLSEGEVEIYLALLSCGECLVSALAKTTGAHRTHIYDTLEKLMMKGLVNFSIKENRKYYAATNPERLLDHLREKQERVEAILPMLLSQTTTSSEEVKVELYKGVAGMKVIIRELLETTTEFQLFGKSRFEEILPQYYLEKIVNELNRKKIKEFMLLEKGQKVLEAQHGEYRYLNPEHLFPTATLLYNNKVALFIWKKPIYIILIEDEEMAKSYMNHFNLLWKLAEKSKSPKSL